MDSGSKKLQKEIFNYRKSNVRDAIGVAALRVSTENTLLNKAYFLIFDCLRSSRMKTEFDILQDVRVALNKEFNYYYDDINIQAMESDIYYRMLVTFIQIRTSINLDTLSIVGVNKGYRNLSLLSSDCNSLLGGDEDEFYKRKEKQYLRLLMNQVKILKKFRKMGVSIYPWNWKFEEKAG